jgi:putative Ca2+/H+ antiporter (TMEM165/GDT1 family)
MIGVFLAAYGAVFLAEIVGDKLLFTTAALSARYRPAPILLGMTAAFMAKMAVAVALGQAIATLPRSLVGAITAASFLGVAFVVWRQPARTPQADVGQPSGKTAMVSFAAIFLSEWGDIGQVTAAMMAARLNSPIVVWLGAVGAVVTKGVLAASVGAGLRRWTRRRFPPAVIRYGAVALFLVIGLLSAVGSLTEAPRPGPGPERRNERGERLDPAPTPVPPARSDRPGPRRS